MYSMKKACELTGMTYENLKFYCNEGLVPNVKRDSRNFRIFDGRDIEWIKSLTCLKKCGMSIAEMKVIDWKQGFYDDVLSSKIPYRSNHLPQIK